MTNACRRITLCIALACALPLGARADDTPAPSESPGPAPAAPEPPAAAPADEPEAPSAAPAEPASRPTHPPPRAIAPRAEVTFIPEPRYPRADDRFELTLNVEGNGLSATRMGRITDSADALGIALRFGWKASPRLALYGGWRTLTGLSGDFGTYRAETHAHAGLVGARWTEPLLGWLDLAFEVDLELLHARTEIHTGGLTGRDGGLGFGLVPRFGLGAHTPFLDALTLHIRLMVGFALRSSHRLDALTFDVDHAGAAVTTDLGSTNLSGPVIALSIGLAF